MIPLRALPVASSTPSTNSLQKPKPTFKIEFKIDQIRVAVDSQFHVGNGRIGAESVDFDVAGLVTAKKTVATFVSLLAHQPPR